MYWAASDVGWVVGHSYIVYAPLLRGCTSDHVRGQAGRHARCRRVLAGDRRARRGRCSPRPPRCAPSSSRTPTAKLLAQLRPVEIPDAVPRRRALRSADTVKWAERHAAKCRWSTTGGRPRPAGRSPAIPIGLGLFPFKPGSPTVRDARLRPARRWTRTATRWRANQIGSIVVKLPLPPGCVPTLWQNDERMQRQLSRRISRASTRRRRRLDRRRRLRLGHGPHRRHHQRRRPPAVDRRRWRRCWPRTRTSPNAR